MSDSKIELFDKRYEIIASLGVGATGTVYKAHDILLLREVALKVLHKHLLADFKALERFKHEANTITALSHPNIVKIFKQAVAEDGRVYIVMDLLKGESLAARLARVSTLQLDVFFQLFLQLADALSYAHQEDLVHLDIKTSNIMITDDAGELKATLVDFGLAKCISPESQQEATQTAQLLGSAAYMSPEQCLGQKDLDARSDIYSLACVMLEALSGKPPFQGESLFELMYKQLNESPAQVSALKDKNIPAALAKIIATGLEKDRALRYQSMDKLKQELQECAESCRQWKREKDFLPAMNRKKAAMVSLACLLLLACGLLLLQQIKNSSLTARKASKQADNLKSLNMPLLLDVDELEKMMLRRNHGKFSEEDLKVLKKWQSKHSAVSKRYKIEIMSLFAKVHAELNHLAEAEKYAEKTRQMAVPDRENEKGYPLQVVYMTIALMGTYKEHQQNEQMIDTIDKALSLNLEYPPFYLVQLNDWKGEYYFNKSDYKNAAMYYLKSERYLKQDPQLKEKSEFISYRTQLMRSLCEMGRKKEVEAIIDDCFYNAKNYMKDQDALARTCWHVACFYGTIGDFANESKYLEQAYNENTKLKMDKEARDCLFLLCQANHKLHKYEKAYEWEKLRLDLTPKWIEQVAILSEMVEDARLAAKYNLEGELIKQALVLCHKNLASAKETLSGGECAQLRTSLNNVYGASSHDKWAIPIANAINEIIEKAKSIPNIEFELSYLYQAECVYVSAAKQNERALDLAEKSVASLAKFQSSNTDDPRRQIELSNAYIFKSRILTQEAKDEDAIQDALRALELLKDTQANRPAIISIEWQLAWNYYAIGKEKEARSYLRKTEALWHKTYREWNCSSGSQMAMIANMKSEMKEYAEAEKIYKYCIEGLLKAKDIPPDYLGGSFYSGHADLLLYLNRRDDAVKELEESLRLYRLAGMLVHPAAKKGLGQLVTLYLERKENKKAEELARQLVAVSDPQELASSYFRLDQVLAVEQDTAKRIIVLEKGLTELEGLKDIKPKDMLLLQQDLSAVFLFQHDPQKAKSAISRLIETANKVPVADGPSNNRTLEWAYAAMAQAQIMQKDSQSANKSLDQAEKFAKLAGSEGLADLKSNLAICLVYAKAANLESEILELEKRVKSAN